MFAQCGIPRRQGDKHRESEDAVAGAAGRVRRHVVEAHPTIVFATLAISRWMEATDRLVT